MSSLLNSRPPIAVNSPPHRRIGSWTVSARTIRSWRFQVFRICGTGWRNITKSRERAELLFITEPPTEPRPQGSATASGQSWWRSLAVAVRLALLPGPTRRPLLQERRNPLLGIHSLRVRGHHFFRISVGFRLIQIDLRVIRLLAQSDGKAARLGDLARQLSRL